MMESRWDSSDSASETSQKLPAHFDFVCAVVGFSMMVRTKRNNVS
jgi:hypothetical protein